MPSFVSRHGAGYEAFKDSLKRALPLPSGVIRSLSMGASTLHQKYVEDFVFIHINKCGGTSMERALGIPLLNHDTALERRAKLGRKRWDARYKFALIRNPYDRLASKFFHGMRMNVMKPGEPVEFAAWMAWLANSIESGTMTDKFKMPQTHWVCDHSGKALLDDLWKLETIAQDRPALEAKLGRPIALPEIKQGIVTKDYRALYGPAEREIMKRHFASDFEMLGYDLL
jgi:hypothetical protein